MNPTNSMTIKEGREDLWKEIRFGNKTPLAYYPSATPVDESIIASDKIMIKDYRNVSMSGDPNMSEVVNIVNVFTNQALNHPSLWNKSHRASNMIAVKCQIKGMKDPVYLCSYSSGMRIICTKINRAGEKYPV